MAEQTGSTSSLSSGGSDTGDEEPTEAVAAPAAAPDLWARAQALGNARAARAMQFAWSFHRGNQNGYLGSRKDGQPHGKGRMRAADGSYYAGEFAHGEMHGRGRRVAADGEVYEGQWGKDARSGYGRREWPNGDTHEGRWRSGRPHGEGTLRLASGLVRRGEWRRGALHGEGHEFLPAAGEGGAGAVEYDGEFVKGVRQGQGVERVAGNVYEGGWGGGQRQGQGALTTAMGHRYEGGWEAGELRHGKFVGRWRGEYTGAFRTEARA
jgi:hypothetical protein